MVVIARWPGPKAGRVLASAQQYTPYCFFWF